MPNQNQKMTAELALIDSIIDQMVAAARLRVLEVGGEQDTVELLATLNTKPQASLAMTLAVAIARLARTT